MAKAPSIESLLKSGSTEWNKLRKAGKVPVDHTGATFAQLFSANADLSGLQLVGTEWEKCDLSKMNFREADLSNAYFHGGRLQDCDFRGANLEGATFEKLKLLRCDFTGAVGIEDLELDDVDMDRVSGLNGEEPPPPPPPPVHGLTHFTREQRTAREAAQAAAAEAESTSDLPPFRPTDSPGALFFRGLRALGNTPSWVLDLPGLRPTPPSGHVGGSSLESQYREAVRAKLDGRSPEIVADVVARAQKALRFGAKDAAHAASYLREVNVPAQFRFSAAKALKEALRAEVDTDDLTASVDPRITGALLELKLPFETADHGPAVRTRLAATQLFTSLLEAGFTPEHNWQEAIESQEVAIDLANQAAGGVNEALTEAFEAFAALPDEARLRRLGYLSEATFHLDLLRRLPEGTEPKWVHEPEARECDDREMLLIGAFGANEIPARVPALAEAELGIAAGTVPEESEDDLFLHFRCEVCGKEKLVTQAAG